MLAAIRVNVLVPLLSRAGTAVTAWMVGQGIDQTLAGQVALGAAAVFLIAFDLMIAAAERMTAARKAVQSLVSE